MTRQVQWVASTKNDCWREKDGFCESVGGEVNLKVLDESFQKVDGFGGCFNELGFEALRHLPEEERENVFYSLFHPDGEQKFSICRLPIGASDYALEWYSLN